MTTAQRSKTAFVFSPFSPEAWEDPYALYRVLRRDHPVYRGTALAGRSGEFYALSRYADLLEYGRDWETFSYANCVDVDNTGQEIAPGNFLETDPPAHTKLRKVLSGFFRPKELRARLEGSISATVESVVATLREERKGDLADDLAWPLSISTSGALLGFPSEDRAMLRELSQAFMQREVGSNSVPAAAREATRTVHAYFAELLDERRRHPREDILSHIANTEVEGQPLGDEAIGMTVLLYFGSLDTSACLITNALFHLERHPDQRAWLAEHLDAVPAAIEEVLRFDAPQLQFKRTTKRPVEVRGVDIPAGASVIFLYGSANRDEDRFNDAEQFDIRRKAQRHLAFGDGIHHCLGAPMARLEAVAAVEGFLHVMPEYQLTDGSARLPNHSTRGYVRLPFTCDQS